MVVVVVMPDRPAQVARYWEREGLPFVGLADPDRRVLSLYGQRVDLLRLGRLPAALIIGRDGRIRGAHYGNSMRDLPDTGDLLARLPDG